MIGLNEAIGLGILAVSSLAVIVSLYSSHQSNKHIEKQLEIEQEPYVVILDGMYVNEPHTSRPGQVPFVLKIKNIGRGPALRVTVTTSRTDQNKAFFEASEPHSIDLSSGDEKFDWKVDENNLDVYIGESYEGLHIDTLLTSNPVYLYVYCYDQLGKIHKTKTKLESCNPYPYLKVMENIKLSA